MRDSEKVVIGFGSIWGLFAFGAILFSSFTIGSNDTAPEMIAIVLYGLTILPTCILSIWFRKPSAVWLIALSLITAFGWIFQMVQGPFKYGTANAFALSAAQGLLISGIPAFIGWLLIRLGRDRTQPQQ